MRPQDYIFVGFAFSLLAAAIAMRLAAGLEVPVWFLQNAVAPMAVVGALAWVAGRIGSRWE